MNIFLSAALGTAVTVPIMYVVARIAEHLWRDDEWPYCIHRRRNTTQAKRRRQ
jgi:hypothetical protein